MTKMASMPIYGKIHLKKNSMQPVELFRGILDMKHQGLQLIIVCSNNNPGLTLSYFLARSNFAT